jgi:hypothetical protein
MSFTSIQNPPKREVWDMQKNMREIKDVIPKKHEPKKREK